MLALVPQFQEWESHSVTGGDWKEQGAEKKMGENVGRRDHKDRGRERDLFYSSSVPWFGTSMEKMSRRNSWKSLRRTL